MSFEMSLLLNFLIYFLWFFIMMPFYDLKILLQICDSLDFVMIFPNFSDFFFPSEREKILTVLFPFIHFNELPLVSFVILILLSEHPHI